jgi:Ca2+-dependent lipid-binding protein
VSIKSTVKPKTLNPTWNEDYDFGIEKTTGAISISLFDKDLTFDDSLGTAEVDLQSVPRDHPREFTLPVCPAVSHSFTTHTVLRCSPSVLDACS